MSEPMADTNGAPEIPPERFAQKVLICYQTSDSVRETLTDLRKDQLQGEPVQDRLNDVFDRMPALQFLAIVEKRADVVGFAKRAVADGHLDEEIMRWFLTWWSEVRWVADGIKAYLLMDAYEPTPPFTDVDFEYTRTSDGLFARHRMEFGVDRVHSIRAPAREFFADGVLRLKSLATALNADDRELTDQEKEQLALACEPLEEVYDELKALTETVDTSGDAITDNRGVLSSDSDEMDLNDLVDSTPTHREREEDDDSEDTATTDTEQLENQLRGFY